MFFFYSVLTCLGYAMRLLLQQVWLFWWRKHVEGSKPSCQRVQCVQPSQSGQSFRTVNTVIYFIYYFNLIFKVVNSEAPFLPRDGRNHHCIYPRRGGQAEWAWVAWINTGMIYPSKVVTNPSTNRAQCSLTSLMWQMLLPLRQNSHYFKRHCNVSFHLNFDKMA